MGRVEEKRKPEERELLIVVERKAKGEERAREVGGEDQRTTGGTGHQTARLRQDDLPGHRGGEQGKGRAPGPSLAAPQVEWLTVCAV